MSREYYTVHEMTEFGPSPDSWLHYSATFGCWRVDCVSMGGRNWVEGGMPFSSLEVVYRHIEEWRNGREYRPVPIAIVHHVTRSEIIEEIPAGSEA